jgi:predicted transposase YdaD
MGAKAMGDIEDAIRQTTVYQELFQKPLDKVHSEAFAEGYQLGVRQALREIACRSLGAGMPVETLVEVLSESTEGEVSREEVEVIVETVLQDLHNAKKT